MRFSTSWVLCLFVSGFFSIASAQDNVAPLGVASQTSTWDNGALSFPANLANDGDLTNFTATAADDDNAMWEVDLGAPAEISSIVLHNRDNCCPSRLRDIIVSIHDISFLDDDPVDDLVLGTPTEEIEEIWESATYETEVLNLENELGGGGEGGPEFLTVDLEDRTGDMVTGRFVRVLRIADPDLSGTGGLGSPTDEPVILSLGEVEVLGELLVECPEEGDTHCEEITVTPLGGDGPGLYEVAVIADDDSGDSVLYTFFADKGGERQFVAGPQTENTATFDLSFGSWTLSALVDDSPVCDDVADDATCAGVPLEIENDTGNFALSGAASQSSDFNATLYHAEDAIDGDLGNFTATASDDANPIWEVDLLEARDIGSIVVHNRDSCCASRLRDIIVSIHDLPFTEDEIIDAKVDGIPIDEIEPVWDSARFESVVLNPENVLGNATLDMGPEALILDLLDLAGDRVTGRYVRVLRISDPDLSGTGGAGNVDEPNVMSLGEVEVLGDSPCAGAEGDTHCEDLVVEGPPEGGAGTYTVTVFADDDSGDEILYTITANEAAGAQLLFGPSPLNTTTFDLTAGIWTITSVVDDGDVCASLAADATCTEIVNTDSGGPLFVRGDTDASGTVNITDPVALLNHLFAGAPGPVCREAADADAGGAVNITDAVSVLNFLFAGGAPPAAPYPDCGPNPDGPSELGCESSPGCEPAP